MVSHTQAEQPHWITPLVTVTPRLEQELRYDFSWQEKFGVTTGLYGGGKGVEVRANPYGSLVFPWHPMHRQVLVRGEVFTVDRAETDAYFALRPRGAQLGAWASPQSEVIASRSVLEEAWDDAAGRFPEGEPVPAPPHWGGLRVVPQAVEFWQGRESRLHDRLRYRRAADGWVVERLAP